MSVAGWARAFALTLLVEEVVVLAMIRSGTPLTVVCEAWAIVIEAALYAVTMKGGVMRAFGVSAIANAASFSAGIVVRSLTGWV